MCSCFLHKKQYELVFDVDGIDNLTDGRLDRLLSHLGFDVGGV